MTRTINEELEDITDYINTNYYILYRAIKNEDGEIIDAENIADFNNYREIQAYINSSNRRDIKKMLVNDIDKLEDINLFRGSYFICRRIDVED